MKWADRVLTPSRADVDFARGVACLLVVFFHVVGGYSTSGLKIHDDSILRDVLSFLSYIRMPLFAFISGYVYDYRPVKAGQVRAFLTGKFRRAGLPLIFVSTMFFVFQTLFGQRVVDIEWWQIYFFNYEVFWFLQAILLIFAVVAILDSKELLKNPTVVMILIAILACIGNRVENQTFLSSGAAAYIAPFFLFGLVTHRFASITNLVMCGLVALLATSSMLHAGNVLALPSGALPERASLLSLIIGVSAAIILIHKAPKSRFTSRIGQSSMAVFLYHIFFIFLARRVVSSLGSDDLVIHICVGTISGIFGPLVVENVVLRLPVLRTILLGVAGNSVAKQPAAAG